MRMGDVMRRSGCGGSTMWRSRRALPTGPPGGGCVKRCTTSTLQMYSDRHGGDCHPHLKFTNEISIVKAVQIYRKS